MFLPILLSFLHWIPFMDWTGPMMGNLFGIFVICYVIMWFAVPAARTARQKLEMNGEKITAQSIRETTEATAGCDPDVRAKPIVAEAVSVFGKVVLILLKLFAGLLVFGLIMGACALIIGLFALVIGGGGILSPFSPLGMTLWVPILGIFIVLIPVILLIYVLMCLIASRKPGGTAVLIIFLLWLASFIACACIAIREDVGDRFRAKRNVIEQVLNTEVVIDNDTTTVQKLLEGVRKPERHRRRPQDAAHQHPEQIDRHYDRQRQGRAGSKGRRQTGEGREKPQGFGRRGRYRARRQPQRRTQTLLRRDSRPNKATGVR